MPAPFAAVVVCALAAVLARGALGADGFVEGMEDVPLMAELTQRADAGMVFDAPSGRIVEAVATGAVNRGGVLAFYAATLPQLGWQRTGETEFRREGEVLRLEITGRDPATVRITLAPVGAKP
jgi:hypothetical protein